MAKRRPKESALNTAAANVGSTLGRLAARVDSFNRQRATLISEIHRATSSLLQSLGEGIQTGRGGPGLPVKSQATTRRPRRWKMSAAARAKLRASAKARWAAAKKAGKTRLG